MNKLMDSLGESGLLRVGEFELSFAEASAPLDSSVGDASLERTFASSSNLRCFPLLVTTDC